MSHILKVHVAKSALCLRCVSFHAAILHHGYSLPCRCSTSSGRQWPMPLPYCLRCQPVWGRILILSVILRLKWDNTLLEKKTSKLWWKKTAGKTQNRCILKMPSPLGQVWWKTGTPRAMCFMQGVVPPKCLNIDQDIVNQPSAKFTCSTFEPWLLGIVHSAYLFCGNVLLTTLITILCYTLYLHGGPHISRGVHIFLKYNGWGVEIYGPGGAKSGGPNLSWQSTHVHTSTLDKITCAFCDCDIGEWIRNWCLELGPVSRCGLGLRVDTSDAVLPDHDLFGYEYLCETKF